MGDFSYPSKIHTLSFYVLDSEENRIDSNIVVNNKELFKADLPISEGVYDAHMGTTDQSWLCETCGNAKTKCPGHSGSIELHYPVKSPLFRDQLLKWLKVICFNCGKVITNKTLKTSKSKLLTEYVKITRSIINCVHCDTPHPIVRKDKFEQAIFYTEPHDKISKREELYNHEIKSILEKISDETIISMGKPVVSHPKKFILDVIRVAPNTIRPDIRRIGGNRSNNNDITALTKNIIEINNLIPDNIPEKINIGKDLREMYFNLDMTYYELVKGSSGSNNQIRMITNTNKVPNSIANRIPKKEGRIRRNLMGKRTRFMMRSVITGDAMLKIDEIGIPISIAKSIQLPETVRSFNHNRLNIYFMNKNKTYPGCSKIIKNGSGIEYKIEYLSADYKLQIGDIILRDMIDGDFVGFNRQPSLLFSSISCHKVVILHEGLTLRMNVSACNLYNADFDGDQMNGIVAQNIQSINEISKNSAVGNWFISYQNNAPMFGAFQDTLVGTAEFTQSEVVLDKYHAMSMFSNIDESEKKLNFTKKVYNSREVISMLIPPINYPSKKSSLYMPQYNPFIKYNPKDISVHIERGNLVSGILDKSTIGQNTTGSIFHVINNEYGSDRALNSIYAFQQLTSRFFLYKGFTIGINDINISANATKKVKEKTAAMILESRSITSKLNKRKLLAPIGLSLSEYYEMEQLNALEAGDDFVEPILADIDFKNNKMAKMVFTGSKGKATNVISVNGALGSQTINGRRMDRQFGWGRTSPYFLRYDMEPRSLGYISTSFKEGIQSDVFPFAAAEARHGLINNALSTSITGHQNRLSIKNLETIIVDNLYKSVKNQNIVQLLYLESGLDPRKTENVKFLTVMISDNEMKKNYHATTDMFNKQYHNNVVKDRLDKEFDQLLLDRASYRHIFMKVEDNNPGNVLIDNKKQMPVNVFRMIEDVIYNYKDEMDELPESKKILDPIKSIDLVQELCELLPYAYYNEIQERKKMKIPEYIKNATVLTSILIRSYLCTANLIKKKLNNILLNILITRVRVVFKKALVSYGTSAGIIAAQCVSEPMTQYILDSKHRVGLGGKQTNAIIRVKEILGAKHGIKMKNPSMLIMVLDKYKGDRNKVQEIANHIEMMDFNRFVYSSRIFFEEYGKPIHEKFKDKINMIKNFEKYNYGIVKPDDLTKWCIMFELNKEEMILNSMKLETIIFVLQATFPNIYFIYSAENDNEIVIRCYIRNAMLKTSNTEDYHIINIMNELKQTVIRGIINIQSTNVIKIAKSKIADDGSISNNIIYGIETVGSNLEEVLDNPYVDIYKTQTDSIKEFEMIFGIEATRNKIIIELQKALNLNIEQCTIFADEMTYTGSVTSIQRTGLQKREMSNVMLRLSFQSPIQVMENAAVDGLIDKISGISGPLMTGTAPNIGTTYNKVLVSEKFINEYHNTSDKLDNEL
jgi:DNA-directed RNA polymerase II subunit RPB1